MAPFPLTQPGPAEVPFGQKEIVREFLFTLNAEESRIFGELIKDDVGTGLLTAIKEFDFYYHNLVRHEYAEEPAHHFHLAQLGLPRLILSILGGVPSFRYPTVTFQSPRDLVLGALQAMGALGFIEQARRLAHAVMAGECEIRAVDDRNYEFILPDIMLNMEQHEASVENHYRRLQRQAIDEAVQETFGKRGVIDRIEGLFSDNVHVFGGKFIGYDAHPDIDDFFFGMAYHDIQTHSGFDTFHGSVRFGGVTFQKYMLAIIYFLSLSMKHERFAEALVRKSPEIRLRDILTITCDRAEFDSLLAVALNRYGTDIEGFTPVTEEEARTIIRVLSVRRDNLAILDSTLAPLPYLIEFSDTAWIKSVAGASLAPVDFLLASLRFNFPGDYDRHQQLREGSMQRALRSLLDGFIPGLTFIENVKIRVGGRMATDVDFATVDEASGDVLLFQLKHQDHYRGDMRSRSNRGKRLRDQSASWLARMREWLASVPESRIRSALRLRASEKPLTCRIVILTRHFAHFLSVLDLENDATYATWSQFFDALVRLRAERGSMSLPNLFAILQRFVSHRMVRGEELDLIDNYHLDSLSYRIRPVSAEGTELQDPDGPPPVI